MPANRMKAAVGSTLKVIGSSSAMVSAGPRPGSTPIAVPSVVPTRHHIRLIGVSATAKPLSELREGFHVSRPRDLITRSIAFSTSPAPILTPSALAKPK